MISNSVSTLHVLCFFKIVLNFDCYFPQDVLCFLNALLAVLYRAAQLLYSLLYCKKCALRLVSTHKFRFELSASLFG